MSYIQFRQNNFLSLIKSVIQCLDLVRKCHKKLFILLNIKNIFKQDSRLRIRKKKMDRIRNTAINYDVPEILFKIGGRIATCKKF